ncbi:MAG: FtsW/RodA/SpoVE family cell cycle protein [Fimbriimonadaceae bacterium]
MSLAVNNSSLTIEKRSGKGHDWGLILSALAILIVGIFSLYSIDNARHTIFASRQMIFAAIGFGVFFICNKIKLEVFKAATPILYIINIGLLAATLLFGKSRGETARWIEIGSFQFQPSEVSKLILAITLAAYFANREDRLTELKTYLGALLHCAPILALVLLQPHLGATIALLFLGLVVAITAGVPWKFFPLTIVLVLVLGVSSYQTKVMPAYMRARIDSKIQHYVHGKKDKQNADMQQFQSSLAFGMGGATGTGWFQGEQKALGAIPEQESDFIFSVIGEEGGFFGSSLVVGLYCVFFFFVWRRVYLAQTLLGRLVASGLFAVLAFHTVVNLAMVLGFGPVVGLWLPFMSHGGTALWMCFGALGLLDQCE